MNEIRTQIVINASKEMVWQILTDFPAYENWNPFIVKIVGKARPEAMIGFVASTNGIKLPIVARILAFEKNKRLSWGGPANRRVKQLFGAEHYFIIEAINADRCRFINGEKMFGVIPNTFWSLIKQSRPAYSAMNECLKRRAEDQRRK